MNREFVALNKAFYTMRATLAALGGGGDKQILSAVTASFKEAEALAKSMSQD